MVLYTFTKYVSNWMAPRLLRFGVSSRHRFFPHSTSYHWDFLCGLAVAQRLTSLSVYEQSRGSNNRLQVLEDHVGSALSKTEQWKWNIRLLKWLRQEVLVAKYEPKVKEAFDAYPQLRFSPQLSRHPTLRMLRNLAKGNMGWTTDNDSKSKLLLPSTETVLKAFEMRKWTNTKQSIVAVEQQQTEATIVDHYNMAAEGSAGYIQHCGPFNAVCEEANIYQLWTKEYVENLGNYLIHQNPSIVLDVGAGDGLLIHYLQQHAKKRRNSISWIATDNGSWRIFAKAQVERLSVQQALETYASSKTIVLCSWMPVGVDWTKLFRQHQVQEYILIGEADDGSCGNQDTWGSDKDSPLYEKEGYQRWNMNNLLPFQFSRFDCSVSKSGMTVSFRRRHKMTSDHASL